MSKSKSPIKYFGGKSALTPKMVPFVPKHLRRLSPFFGGGSFEMSLDPIGVSEIFNDINGEVVNFFRVLQNQTTFKNFQLLCELTPFHEKEFEDTKIYSKMDNFGVNVLKAWKFFIRNRLSRGGDGKDFATHSSRLRRSIGENVSAYLSAVEGLADFSTRLRYSEFRSWDWQKFLTTFDNPDSFIYLDPPYLLTTRIAGGYDYEPKTVESSHRFHTTILEELVNVQGKFMISTYPNDLYSKFIEKHGWVLEEIVVKKSSSSKKEKPESKEWLIMNYETSAG